MDSQNINQRCQINATEKLIVGHVSKNRSFFGVKNCNIE
jgi:hypothetical protein